MKNVKPGEVVQLAAQDVNAWNKTAEAYRAGKFQHLESIPQECANPVVVTVQNKTGDFAGIFSIFALGNPINSFENDTDRAMADAFNKRASFEGHVPQGKDLEVICITLGIADRENTTQAAILGAVGCVVDVTSTEHYYAVPMEGDVEKLQSSDSGIIRILNPLEKTGEQFCYVLLGGGGANTKSEPATVIEPIRRPIFRNVPPNPNADDNTPGKNVYDSMGTIKRHGKSYKPIKISEDGEDASDGEVVYKKRREPKTGNERLVIRKDGKTS